MVKGQKSSFSIIPKTKPKSPVWLGVLSWLSLCLLVLVLGLFFFFQYKVSSMEEAIAETENKIYQYSTKDFQELKEEQVAIADKIEYFSGLLKEHHYASKLFFFLKRRCHPKAQITNFNFDANDYVLNIGALTENFRTFGEQLLVFLSSDSVFDLNLSQVALTKEDQVRFELSLYLDEALFVK